MDKDFVPTQSMTGNDLYWAYGFRIEGTDKIDLLVKHILACRESGISSSYSWYGNTIQIKDSVTYKGFDNPEEIRLKMYGWKKRLQFVCEKYGWEYKDPEWIFVGFIFGIHKDDVKKAEQIISEQNL